MSFDGLYPLLSMLDIFADIDQMAITLNSPPTLPVENFAIYQGRHFFDVKLVKITDVVPLN